VPPPTKGDRLPAEHHVLRYIRKKDVDKDKNAINGSGFLARPGEDAPSSNWIECFSAPLANQLAEIRSRKRIQYEKRAKLVRLNVSGTEQHIRDNLAAASDNPAAPTYVQFVHDPLEEEGSYPADPSHALATGVPQVGAGPEAELIGDLFLDCILETIDVVPD
jgi:hypothetical protein